MDEVRHVEYNDEIYIHAGDMATMIAEAEELSLTQFMAQFSGGSSRPAAGLTMGFKQGAKLARQMILNGAEVAKKKIQEERAANGET